MRFVTELVVLLISIVFLQGAIVVRQINDLNAVISLAQVEQFMSADQLQQLQTEIFTTVITGLGNHWEVTTIGQALQQLVTQYAPQLTQIFIDWEAVAQSVVNDVATVFPNIQNGAVGGLFNKREVETDNLQFLAQLPVEDLTQIIQVVNIPDRTTALNRLRQLLQQFFPVFQGRIDFDDIADDLLNNLNNLLPHLGPPNSLPR